MSIGSEDQENLKILTHLDKFSASGRVDKNCSELLGFLARVEAEKPDVRTFSMEDLTSFMTLCNAVAFRMPEELNMLLEERNLLVERKASMWPLFLLIAVASGGLLGAIGLVVVSNFSDSQDSFADRELILWAVRGYWLAGLWAAFSLCLAIGFTFARTWRGWAIVLVLDVFFACLGVLLHYACTTFELSVFFCGIVGIFFGITLWSIVR